jgi:hypothetical protein
LKAKQTTSNKTSKDEPRGGPGGGKTRQDRRDGAGLRNAECGTDIEGSISVLTLKPDIDD